MDYHIFLDTLGKIYVKIVLDFFTRFAVVIR